MRFEQIAVVGGEAFTPECRQQTERLSRQPVHWIEARQIPAAWSHAEVDALLVALRVEVAPDIVQRLPKLRYLGVYGTNLAPVPLAVMQRAGVTVTNVHGYCDPDTAEWCMMEILNVARGRGPLAWRPVPHAVQGRRLGIVGLGAVGLELARRALAFGMEVAYTSKSPKPEVQAVLPALRCLPLDEVLKTSEFLSLHTPASLRILTNEHMKHLPAGGVLINTCIGEPYDHEALRHWLEHRDGLLVLDALAGVYHREFHAHPRVYVAPVNAHTTAESEQRRRAFFMQNMREFLGQSGR